MSLSLGFDDVITGCNELLLHCCLVYREVQGIGILFMLDQVLVVQFARIHRTVVAETEVSDSDVADEKCSCDGVKQVCVEFSFRASMMMVMMMMLTMLVMEMVTMVIASSFIIGTGRYWLLVSTMS